MGNNSGMLLRDYLAQSGETIDQFAGRVGESPHTIGKLYRGERFPRVQLAQRIVEATEGAVTADDLLEAASKFRSKAA
jgi:transcriptional regulator with XRE-family HTH domain